MTNLKYIGVLVTHFIGASEMIGPTTVVLTLVLQISSNLELSHPPLPAPRRAAHLVLIPPLRPQPCLLLLSFTNQFISGSGGIRQDERN
jgi:hypothetical protein